MLNHIHRLSNKTSSLHVYQFVDKLKAIHNVNGVVTHYFVEASLLDKIKAYKSVDGAMKFCKRHMINKTEAETNKFVRDYVRYCMSKDENFCPAPVPSCDGATLQPKSTPQDKTVSNGVPVSDDSYIVDCCRCGKQLGVEVFPIDDAICHDCYENEHRDEIGIGYAERHCTECGEYHENCICETCADCGVITKLIGGAGGTQCKECYQLSQQPIFKVYRKTDDPENYRHEVYPSLEDDDIPPMYGLGA